MSGLKFKKGNPIPEFVRNPKNAQEKAMAKAWEKKNPQAYNQFLLSQGVTVKGEKENLQQRDLKEAIENPNSRYYQNEDLARKDILSGQGIDSTDSPIDWAITGTTAPARGLGKMVIESGVKNFAKSKTGKVLKEAIDVIDPTSMGFGLKRKPKFESEIDWAKWNPDTPKHKVLMDEYREIERKAKADGTWMKNPDGTPFRGRPEQFVQQNSSWFKKAFADSKTINPDGSFEPVVHSTPAKFEEFDKSFFGQTDEGYHGKGFYFSPIQRAGTEGEFYQRPYKWLDDKTVQGTHNYGKNKMMLYIKPDKIEGGFPVKPYTELIVDLEKPGNIKSAVGNVGFFDTSNPNIYRAITGVGATGALYNQTQKEKKRFGGIIFKKGGSIFDKEKKKGLRGWFERPGGQWVDCISRGPCGGEKAGKKRLCRPTLADCPDRSKLKSIARKKKMGKPVSWK